MSVILDGDMVVGSLQGDGSGVELPADLVGLPLSALRFVDGALIDARTLSVFWIDPDGRKHAVAGPDRSELVCSLDDDVEPDGEGTWRIVDRLARLKERRKAAIDEEAERQRLRWITPGAGQAMTYQAKVEEARALALEGEEADPSHYPMLSAEVGITAATLQDVAGVVMSAYQQWQAIGAAIEAARLGAKRAVELAETTEDVAAIDITWPSPA